MVVLLTPYRKLSISYDLCCQNTFNSLIKSFRQPLTHCLVGEVTVIRKFSSHNVMQYFQCINYRIIIKSNMYLISAHFRPELRPSAILILTVQKILHRQTESVTVAHIVCLPV